MAGDRSRYGLLLSALGAILLAVSVFLPWYGLSFTASGLAAVQRLGEQFVSQFGNSSLQSYTGALHANLGGLAGQEFTSLSAHQALRNMNLLLLALAGLAVLDALIPLARSGSPAPDGGGAALVLLGAIASVCVAYRMVHPPTIAEGALALSLREGAWLALVGSLAILAGGLWPRGAATRSPSEASIERTWSGFSGWTPQA